MADNVTLSLDLASIVGNLAAFGTTTAAKSEEVLAQAGEMALQRAIELTPVLTGYLQSRNQVDVQAGVATLSNDADYAVYVELGTSKMSAEPYLTPALQEAGNWLLQQLGSLV